MTTYFFPPEDKIPAKKAPSPAMPLFNPCPYIAHAYRVRIYRTYYGILRRISRLEGKKKTVKD